MQNRFISSKKINLNQVTSQKHYNAIHLAFADVVNGFYFGEASFAVRLGNDDGKFG